MSTFEVVTVGETMGQFVPREGTIVSAENFALNVAGSESNVALALSGLGLRVSWASRIGEDAVGERILGHLRARGVDTSMVQIDPAARTGIFLKEPAGSARRVFYYRQNSAASRIDSQLMGAAVSARPRALFLSGITAALSPRACEAVEFGLRAARAQGVLAVFDINYRPMLWSAPSIARDVLARCARSADLVLVGDEEAEDLWGTDDPTQIRAMIPDPELVIRRPPRDVVVFEGDNRTETPIAPVEVVESVGAGDAFAAGYLFARLRGDSVRDRVHCGHAMAASSLSHSGDHADLGIEQLDEAIASLRSKGETA